MFGRRFIAYLMIVVTIGALTAALAALLTARPVAAAGTVAPHPLAQDASDSQPVAPLELAFTGTDDLTLSLLGVALVVGGCFLLITAKQVDQRGR